MTATSITPPAHRTVAFVEAVQLFFKNYATFNGRSSRGAYWWYVPAIFGASLVAAVLDGVFFAAIAEGLGGNGPFGLILSLATLVPGIALGVRRLHDIDRSGWWTLIAFTVIGIIPLIYWACLPGNRAANKFGPDIEAGR